MHHVIHYHDNGKLLEEFFFFIIQIKSKDNEKSHISYSQPLLNTLTLSYLFFLSKMPQVTTHFLLAVSSIRLFVISEAPSSRTGNFSTQPLSEMFNQILAGQNLAECL